MYIPGFQDVLLARQRIRPYLASTPLHSYAAVNDLLGASVYVKHENYQPVGAFKVRGVPNAAMTSILLFRLRVGCSALGCYHRLEPAE